jgi:3-methyladenine DNA glycosylase AlkD
MEYSSLLEKLSASAEAEYAAFSAKLTPTKYPILGVRVPILRKLAKAFKGKEKELLAFPNDSFEMVFIKLFAVAALPYEDFIKELPYCVALIDNWAHCDSFKARCIEGRKGEFLAELERIFTNGGEFGKRYVLVTLLFYYVDKEYLPTILSYIERTDTSHYYLTMAVAWLTAELLAREYDVGVKLLKKGVLDVKTHNKAIQKGIESYRITNERKEFLRSLKIKTKR